MSADPPLPPRPDAPVPVEPPDVRPKATWTWFEAVGVYVFAFLVSGFVTLPLLGLLDETEDTSSVVITVVAALTIVGVVVLWLSRFHRGWPAVMGLPPREGTRREIGAGVVFGLGLYPVMVVLVGGVLVVLLELVSGEPVRVPEQVGDDLSTVGLALTLAYAVAIAPVAEELFFRGVLFRALRDRYGFWVGALGSGVGFGLIHFIPGPAVDAVLLMLVMTATGFAFCLLYERRGTIVAPLAAHITFNVIGLTLILGLR